MSRHIQTLDEQLWEVVASVDQIAFETDLGPPPPAPDLLPDWGGETRRARSLYPRGTSVAVRTVSYITRGAKRGQPRAIAVIAVDGGHAIDATALVARLLERRTEKLSGGLLYPAPTSSMAAQMIAADLGQLLYADPYALHGRALDPAQATEAA